MGLFSLDAHQNPRKGIACLSCPFCEEMQGNDNLFKRLLGDRIPDRTIKSTENFVVWPGLGPIGEGYVLILPREHHICMAALPVNLMSEFSELKCSTIDLLRQVYRTGVIAFEHGPAHQTARGGSCLDHAHMHLVTSDIEFFPMLVKYFEWIPMSDWTTLRKLYEASLAYVYYMAIDGKEYVAVAPTTTPSQFFRMAIAKETNRCAYWDWRSNPQPEAVLKMYHQLARV